MINKGLIFNADTDHFYGSPDAQIEVIQYGDFQCHHCAEVYPHIKMLQEVMGKDMRFIFRHHPLAALHHMSLEAAVATEVAAMQNKFWYMHDIIFENQKFLSPSTLLRFAEAIGIKTDPFENNSNYKFLVRKVITDYENSLKLGVDGTPTFFINQRQYNGFHDFENLFIGCHEALSNIEISDTPKMYS